jgi:CO/xanthine dehydrogenase FAD-binding subunit
MSARSVEVAPVDLNTVSEISRPRSLGELPDWRAGDAWLAGGTWLFSEPQPGLGRLIDLGAMGWPALERTPEGLTIAATCTLGELAAADLPPVFGQCCRALLGSFKVWHAATVGGNLCMALPAGPMAALLTALDAVCVVWRPDAAEQRIAMRDFILGPQKTLLRPGELLRAIEVPATALAWRTAVRQISLAPMGRSGALLVGTSGDGFALTITAATRRPVRLPFATIPRWRMVEAAMLAAIQPADWFDDVHGTPAWRRQVTFHLAEQILAELTP